MIHKLLLILILSIFIKPAISKEKSTLEIKNIQPVKNYTDIYYQPYSFKENKANYQLLKKNTYTMMGASVFMLGFLYVMPESFTNWDKDDAKFNKLFKKWWENVKAGPVMDEDDFVLNYVAHPYCGAVYYMAARSSGLTPLNSFFYSTILSTFFWEYGIEAFAEIPSKQDLIVTPIIGSIFGEGFYLWKRKILQDDYKLLNSKLLGKTMVFFMDPITETTSFFMRKFGKEKNENIAMYSFPIIEKNGNLGYNLTFSMKF